MIDNIQYVAEGSILLTYEVDHIEETLTFEKVQEKWIQINTKEWEFWSELDEDTFEGGTAKALDDRLIIATAYIASGQSGAVFIWDVYKREIVHISNGNFAIAATANDEWVYTLNLIHTFTVPPKLYICRAPMGTEDFSYSEDCDCHIPFSPDDYYKNTGIFEMDVTGNTIIIHMNADIYRFNL